MQAAAFALIVNVFVAGLFSASFAVLAFAYPTQRRAMWFCAAYAIGLLAPLSQFLLPVTGWVFTFSLLSYAGLVTGILAMAAGLAAFARRPVPWRALAAVLAGALLAGSLSWIGQRGTLSFELVYQLPFAAASALCGGLAWRLGRRPLERALAAALGLLAVHFLIKPFVAVTLGPHGSPAGYTGSTYALVSQAATGVLLIAVGLLVLLLVFEAAIAESQRASETDVLSGLANRRGFDERAARALAAAYRDGRPAAVLLFDLDHFKQLNDTWGHAAGDEVIRAFADMLLRRVPPAALVGRIGGEEFAVLADGVDADGAATLAEAIRQSTATLPAGVPPFTVSAGVAAAAPGERLRDAIRRADAALYCAKRGGRDRVALAAAA